MEIKKKAIKDNTVVIRLSSETLKKLITLAKTHKASRTEVIRQLIEDEILRSETK